MFGTQALRLLREGWSGARELAEEIYAILSSATLPLEHSGPITLNNDEGVPLTMRGFGDGDTVIRIKKGDEDFDIKFNTDGDLIFPGTANNARNADQSQQQQQQEQQQQVFRGVILSGSADTYSVQLDGAGAGVSVTQLQIAADETIPAGTGVIVIKSQDGVYSMQVPVWMDG